MPKVFTSTALITGFPPINPLSGALSETFPVVRKRYDGFDILFFFHGHGCGLGFLEQAESFLCWNNFGGEGENPEELCSKTKNNSPALQMSSTPRFPEAALTLFCLLPCCLAFAKQMCWSLKKTDIMNATVPGFFSYPSRNSMILKTLMLFAHAEAEAWSPGARGDMQGDINGFLPHFCHFVGTWFHSPPLQFHYEAQLWLLESEGVGKIYSQSSSMGCMEGYNQKKTNPGKLQWYWNTWNLASKGQQFVSTACSIFCGPFGKWPTENWDLKLRWDFRFVSIKSEGTTDLLPPKQVLYHQTSPEICE